MRFLTAIFLLLAGVLFAEPSGIPLGVTPPAWSVNLPLYEVNVQVFSREGNFKAVEKRLPAIKELGCGIVWLMPVFTRGVRKAFGSPYCVKDYRGLHAPYGTEKDLKDLVNAAHKLGLRVILDWVANHSSWDNALTSKHPDFYKKDRLGEIAQAHEWGDVAQFDFDNQGMRSYMIESMKYWVREFDVDGFRCDVAWGVPVDFWVQARRELDKVKPVYMLAESDKPEYQAAFDSDYDWSLLPNMIAIYKKEKTALALDEQLAKEAREYSPGFQRARFTSNHDEWNKGTVFEQLSSSAKAFAVLAATLPGKPLIYAGQEIGWDKRFGWAINPDLAIVWPGERSPWTDFYQGLFILYRSNPALYAGNFQILKSNKAVFAFLRQKDADKALVALNLCSQGVQFTLESPDLAGKYRDLWNPAKEEKLAKKARFKMGAWEYRVLVSRQEQN